MPAFDDFIFDEESHGGGSDPQLSYYHNRDAGESLAATLAGVFSARSDEFAVGLLINAEHDMERCVDRSTGYFVKYRWIVNVPPALYQVFLEQDESQENKYLGDRTDFVAEAWRLGGAWMEDIHHSDIIVRPKLSSSVQWRTEAQKFLAGGSINNQANVKLGNRPRVVHDELFFRNVTEQYVYEALLRYKHPFMPLPVVLRADGSKRDGGVNRRIEPDFLILYRGRLVLLEVDGGSHFETPVDAENRITFLREQGVVVRRVSAADCKDVEKAVLAVHDSLKSALAEIERAL